jgi:DNA primase
MSSFLDKDSIINILQKKLGVKKTGNNYVALCPFHTEKTPSFNINVEKKFYYCFGCSTSGNLYQLIKEQIGRIVIYKKNKPKKKLITNKARKLRFLVILAEYFKKNLTITSNICIKYLQKREVTSEVIKTFSIGYLYNSELRPFYITHIRSNREYNTILKITNKRVIFPLYNIYNFVIGFSGRCLDDTKPKYLHTPTSDLFKKKKLLYGYNIAKQEEETKKVITVVEGFFDVISLYVKKIPGVVAILGTNISSKQLHTLSSTAKKIILCYDNDLAGNLANTKIYNKLVTKLVPTKTLGLPKNYDPDNFIKAYGKYNFLSRL